MANIAFPDQWFKSGQVKNLCFTTATKIFEKATAILVPR